MKQKGHFQRFPLRKMAAGQRAHKENRPDKTAYPVKHICYNGAAGRAEASSHIPVTSSFHVPSKTKHWRGLFPKIGVVVEMHQTALG